MRTLALCLALSTAAAAQEWHTLHRDAQRSGYTDHVVTGPYERKWYRDFHDEMIATRVEAIVADGKCFVGTFAGNLHALNVADGSTAWKVTAGGPIGHSPSFHDGLLYFGADDGTLTCLKAEDGTRRWSTAAGAGIWVAPLCDGRRVYFGDRAGLFHAVSARTGRAEWTFRTGGPILKPASLSPDGGRIVFASEDMHAYCLSPEGKLLWKSAKMQGVTTRDQAPTIWKGLALFRTSPADGFHEVMNRNQEVLASAQRAIPLGPRDKILNDKHGAYILRYNADRVGPERDAVLQYLEKNPRDRTFYAFRLEDGKEPWTAPIFYTGGLHNPPTAPTFDPKTGELYTFYRTCLTNYSRGVRPFTGVGRLDRETGRIENLWHANGDRIGWSDFSTIGDETESLSLMGEVLLSTHQGTLGGMNVRSRKWHPIYNGRDTYGGIFGPGALPGGWEGEKKYGRQGYLVNMPNEWHGPDRSIVAIAENRLFWVVGSQVVCWGGPDVPKTGTGGRKPPPMIKKRFDRIYAGGGNVTTGTVGGADQLEKRMLTAKDLERYLEPPGASASAGASRDRLDAVVSELVDEGPWAPFILELGISREERHFWRASRTLQIVSLALPHLSPDVRKRAVAYLDRLVAGGAPLRKPVHSPEGKRRERYDLGPGMRKFASETPKAEAGIRDLYGLWAYAHYADRWEPVLAGVKEIRERFAADTSASLNQRIAGTLAFARILSKAGSDAESRRALDRLPALVTERVHHERTDSNFVRRSAYRAIHTATIPRYVDLTPELCAILRKFAPDAFPRNLRGLATQLPVWYQAFAERMIGGENYTHTPELARGLFIGLADGRAATAAELARRLDHPWCRADLYFIEKLTALLRRAPAK